MTPRPATIARAAATAAALTAALAACKPAPGTQTAAPATTTRPAASATTPSCTPDFGPDGTGINAFGGTVTATVTLNCTDSYDTPDPLISLTLVRQPPGSATAVAAGTASYQHPELTYTATGTCAAGDWALHIFWGATVDHHALSDQTWGKPVHLTADQCG